MDFNKSMGIILVPNIVHKKELENILYLISILMSYTSLPKSNIQKDYSLREKNTLVQL